MIHHAGSNIVTGGGSPQTLFDRGQRTAPTERRHCRQSSQQANGKKMGWWRCLQCSSIPLTTFWLRFFSLFYILHWMGNKGEEGKENVLPFAHIVDDVSLLLLF